MDLRSLWLSRTLLCGAFASQVTQLSSHRKTAFETMLHTRMNHSILLLQLCVLLATETAGFRSLPLAFTCASRCRSFLSTRSKDTCSTPCSLWMSEKGDDDGGDSKEGADLAAEFFKMAQEKGLELNADDMADEDEEDLEEDDDEEEEEEEEDEEEPNIPQGAINAFLGYDTGDVGGLAGNVSLTDDKIYSEVKERVLDTAGGFVEYVKGAKDDEDEEESEDEDEGEGEELIAEKTKPYEPPETVPDSELTAGEVVILVMNALKNNDVPTKNRGVEILFGYSSPGSQIKNEEDLTPDEYADFLKETEYKVVFEHEGVSIDKADYSFDGKKAFFTARLKTGPHPLDIVSVNFILSTTGVEEDACWLIDSMLIRPQSMRRRRRR